MAERGLPSSQEAVEIATAYLAEFNDIQKRLKIATNIIIGVYDIWGEMGKKGVEPEEFVDFISKFQSEDLEEEGEIEAENGLVPDRDYTLEMDITRSLKISEFTDAARAELAMWQEGAIRNPALYPLANEWAMRVLVLEDATRIKTQKDAQRARFGAST